MMSETSKMIPSNIPIAFSLQAVDEARSALARSPAWVALPTWEQERQKLYEKKYIKTATMSYKEISVIRARLCTYS
jgi:hypothetical protein